MAITINIIYRGINVKEFAKEMLDSKIVDEIRNEEGNLKYEYYLPFNDDNTVLLIDSWVNQEALDMHHKSEMMEKIIKLREKYNLTMEVKKYIEIDNTTNDLKYIIK